jgi:hypothetical protein
MVAVHLPMLMVMDMYGHENENIVQFVKKI